MRRFSFEIVTSASIFKAEPFFFLSIVNILGAPVAHLLSGELDAGEHDFAWDVQGMAPGSYWCVVRMGDSVERIALSVER